MPNLWMIRAGEGGHVFDDFERHGVAAVGWHGLGDLTEVRSVDELKRRLAEFYPESSKGTIGIWASILFKFRHSVQPGDAVVTYDPSKREYLFGEVTSPYRFDPQLIPEFPNLIDVTWSDRVARDDLGVSSRNSLGGLLTLFEPGTDVLADFHRVIDGEDVVGEDDEVDDEEFEVILRETLSRSHEFIKDRILRLSPDEMEELTASLLRAMGYRSRITPKGPDGGRDVIASPDGLGFQDPRIVAEVKHRPRDSMGADKVRGFLGGLRSGDRGLYVSTGGFTREARYEADRASVPVTLVDSDSLAALVVEHYDSFDSEGRSLIPLKKVYWPLS